MQICPRCNSENVYYSRKKKLSICEDCGFEFSEDSQKSTQSEVFSQSRDDNCWCPELMKIAPVSLANAYYYLRNYVEKQKIGCVLFLIRDVFELFIKIPVVLIFNGIHNLSDSDDKKKDEIANNEYLNLLYQYSFQILSTGKWWECLRLVSRLSPALLCCDSESSEIDFYRQTIEYAAMLYSQMYYETPKKAKNSMVAWRNSALGHSCLAEDPETSYEEIPYILKMFKKVADNSLEYYSAVAFSDAEKRISRGILIPYHIENQVYVSFSDDESHNTYIRINSFIAGQDTNYALFDGYEKGKAYLLNYTDGKRYRDALLSRYLDEKQQKQGVSKTYVMSGRKNIYTDNLETNEINAFVDELSSDRVIYPFDFLRSWLKDEVCKHDRGYLLLTGSSGFGKSVFCDTVDQLNSRGRFIPGAEGITGWDDFMLDTVIRIWHFDSGFHSRKDIYLSGIRDCLLTIEPERHSAYGYHAANAIKGSLEMQWNSLQTAQDKSGTKNQNDISVEKHRQVQFAECLNAVCQEYQKLKGKKRLVLILDGVDELPEKTEVFSFLPSEDDLMQGVFILVVSRTEKETSGKQALNQFFQRIAFCSHFELTESSSSIEEQGQVVASTDNHDYRSILLDYISDSLKTLKAGSSETEAKDLAEMYSYRFSSVSAYLYLCSMNRQFIVESNQDLFRLYWDFLCSRAPSYYLDDVKNVLVTLCYTDEGLTLEEIAYLSRQQYVSFRLLGIMNDIRPFVCVERSAKGNCYRLNHSQWKTAVGELLGQNGELYLKNCTELALELEDTFTKENIIKLLDPAYSGELWLFTHLFSISESIEANKEYEDDIDKVVFNCEESERVFEKLALMLLSQKQLHRFLIDELKENSNVVALQMLEAFSFYTEYIHWSDKRRIIHNNDSVSSKIVKEYVKLLRSLLKHDRSFPIDSIAIVMNQYIHTINDNRYTGKVKKSVLQKTQRKFLVRNAENLSPDFVPDSFDWGIKTEKDRKQELRLIIRQVKELEKNPENEKSLELGNAYYRLGYSYGANGKRQMIEPCLLKAIVIAEELCKEAETYENKQFKQSVEFDLGVNCLSNKKYEDCLYYYFRALKTGEGHDMQYEGYDPIMLPRYMVESCIGICYKDMQEYGKAAEYYIKAREDLATKDYYDLSTDINIVKGLIGVYKKMNMLEEVTKYQNQLDELSKKDQ